LLSYSRFANSIAANVHATAVHYLP